MLSFDLYAIYTTDNEWSGSIKEVFPSFKEAMANRMKYANWWTANGNVKIQKFTANERNFSASEEWDIDADGTISRHYKWR